MRIVIDIDGTICELKKPGQTYSQVRINPEAAEKIKALKDAGHYIILQTARHMKTCNGDVSLVIQKIGKETEQWLADQGIVYDELHYGKPYADVYIDDLGHRFTGWNTIKPEHFNSKKINILIPMAGRGSRFAKAGFTDPKPLIPILGEPMIKWAMKSFDDFKNLPNIQYIFIILKEHNKDKIFEQKLRDMYGPRTVVIESDQVTRGQAETCLLAKDYINNHNKLFIYNCDSFSQAPLLELIEKEDPDGILTCFEATDPRYSFAKLDEYGHVIETAEKKAISNLASTGMYYFKRGADFVAATEEMIRNNELFNNEFFVAPVYNKLIQIGKKIKTVMVDSYNIFGTPEELENFLKTYKA